MASCKKKVVAVVGAGISGLLACKYTLSKGFHPIVFEAENRIGGVWTKTLNITKLQTSKTLYHFSDFPWPSSVTEEFPTHDQVLNYIESYAKHFDLVKHIKFNTKVEGIEYEGPSELEMQAWHLWNGTGEPFNSTGKWKVHVKGSRNTDEVYTVDFVILCLGRFSGVPNIPEFGTNKGLEAFQGSVMHAMDYQSDYDLVKGKQVTVVGFHKTAIDIAMECSALNGAEHPCRVLYRTEHWHMPANIPWPLPYMHLNRFSEFLFHKPGEGFILSFVATLLSPLRWMLSKLVESQIKKKFRLEKYGMVPKRRYLQETSSCFTAVMPDKFYNRVEEGSIVLKKAPTGFGFCKQGIIVDGEATPLNTDMVILATGFRGEKKLKNIFVSPTFQKLIVGQPEAKVPLYRECIHPQIPQLAVIGYPESVSILHTSEMASRWLAELLDGTFKLPSIKEMQNHIAKWVEYMKRHSSGNYHVTRSCMAATQIWYNDQLCKDMGWNPKRKKSLFTELFESYGPLDYANSEN